MAYLFHATIFQRTFAWYGRRHGYRLSIRVEQWDKEPRQG